MNVVVLAGGRSSEHEVSLVSAAAIRDGLAQAGHMVQDVRISKKGIWTKGDEIVKLEPGKGLLEADVVFPALHGPYGEDGTVQGLLEHLDVPYVGPGSLSSAVCMDKAVCKDRMRQLGIPQVEYSVLRGDSGRERAEELGLPVFVKPSRLGSSVGISKAETTDERDAAITEAFRHDSVVLVEKAAPGIEVECGVLGSNDLTISEPGQIAELKVPAEISPKSTETVKKLARRVFTGTGCSGMARIDFFVDGDDVLVSEINTIPGFTPTSAYPTLMEKVGVPFTELLDRLLEDARADAAGYREREH
jgi:D-alanine-D-alanine ligase